MLIRLIRIRSNIEHIVLDSMGNDLIVSKIISYIRAIDKYV